MRTTVLLAFLTSLAFLTMTPPAFSQREPSNNSGTHATTRSIEGRVLTKTGQAVPGAVVLLKDSKSLQVRSYLAQKDGQYHFFGLSTDVNYTLRAENQGMTSKDKMVSVFDSHKVVTLNLKLVKKIPEAKPEKMIPKE